MHPFDDLFICADAGIYKKGSYVANLGIAIEIQEYQEYRQHYFETIDSLTSEYNIRFPKRIIKTSDVYQMVPDHNLSNFIDELTKTLLSSENVQTVQAVHTILKSPVSYPWQTKEISGIDFVKDHLSQYYPIVPVYEYYHNGGESKTAILDGVTGYLTKAWSDAAHKASKGLYIVPHGDETHPCISTCDLVVMSIKHKVYPLTANGVKDFLSSQVPGSTQIYSDFISDGLIDRVRARYSHSIKPEKYYLHPLYLLDGGKDLDDRLIRQTDVYALAHEQAEKHGGSSFNIKIENQLAMLQPGDVVICLSDDSYRKMEALTRLNPRRRIKVYDVEGFLENLESEAKEEMEIVEPEN